MGNYLDKKLLSPKLGTYAVGDLTALLEPLLLVRVQNLRRSYSARMRGLAPTDVPKLIPPGELFISKKIDGEFTVFVLEEEECFAINPGGTIRTGLPWMTEAATLLKEAGVKNALLAGELHVRRADGKRARIHDVVKVARKPENQADLDSLCFAVFDVLELDGKTPNRFSDAWDQIKAIFATGDLVHPVTTALGDGPDAVLEKFEEWVTVGGEEGLVVRGDSAGMFKVKARHSIDLVVVGFAEGIGDRSHLLHDLLLACVREDGSFHLCGRVGGGFKEDERMKFLSDLYDMVAASDYAEVNSDRVAYEMVRPTWVIEISFLDLISENTRGKPCEGMVLQWQEENSRWKSGSRLPIATIISPQFLRIRDDKQAIFADAPITQLTDFLPIAKSEVSAKELTFPKSELISREVATKTLKGATMVRKLLLWKTNKEGDEANFPAYVAYMTDFSPNRKDPLQREIRVSNSFDQIEKLYQDLKSKNFVKGWKLIETKDAVGE